MLISEKLQQRVQNSQVNQTKPWHKYRFIPEIRFHNNQNAIAFQLFKPYCDVAIVNYFDLKERGFLKQGKKHVRKVLGDPTVLILSSVGEDRKLDKILVKDYHDIAISINADAVMTIDDFIYTVDDSYPYFQLHNFARAMYRTRKLIELSNGKYSIMGLVVGKNSHSIHTYVNFLAKCGINDFIFPCGDSLKDFNKHSSELITTFLNVTKELQGWRLLLGINSANILSNVNFNCYSSSQWSYDSFHGRVYKNEKILPARKIILNSESSVADSVEVQRSLHNLLECHKTGKKYGERFGSFE